MNALLTATLTSHIVPGLASVSAGAWRALASQNADSPEEVAAFAAQSLDLEDAQAVAERLAVIRDFEAALDSLLDAGIHALTADDDRYPGRVAQRLGHRAPPLLFAGGNLGLLNTESLGVVGSRDLDEEGASFARLVADEAVRSGYATVSGGAKGADLVAMTATVEAGGNTVGFMSDSLAKGLRSPQMRDALDEGRLCLASPFAPSVGFQVANAMARNKLIYAHAIATVVVSSSEGEGGTWAGAVEALRLGLTPVFVRAGEGVPDGNAALQARGCCALTDPGALWDGIRNYAPAQSSFGF
jgi:predicted Rossmann fold nucleotide-binding protein DprA/Smf involved in DNA uptake